MHDYLYPNSQRPPDFLCIGAQKAGTSWVYSVLYHIAGVFVPPIKESNYLLEASDRDRAWARQYRLYQVEQMEKKYRTRLLPLRDIASRLDQIDHFKAPEVDDDWYRCVFGFARDDQIAGEVCPSYLTLATEQSIRHALQLNPDLRVLMMVRDPVERFWSQIRMAVRYKRVTQPIGSLLHDESALRNFLCFSDYARSIERWSKLLPPGRMRMMLYDNIEQRPKWAAHEILSFLGAESGSVYCTEQRVNAGLPRPMTPGQRRRVLDLMRPQYEYLSGKFPEAVDRWLMVHDRALRSDDDARCDTRESPRVA